MDGEPSEVLDNEEEEQQPSGYSRAYRVTIAALYTLAIVAEAYLAWSMVKDQPEVQAKVAQAKAWWQKKTAGCAGCQRRKEMLNRLLWEAQEIVGANRADVEEAPE